MSCLIEILSVRKFSLLGLLVAGIIALNGCASSGAAGAKGYEVRVRYAEVVGIERVPMPSAAPAGAILGGFTGLVLTSGKSTRSRVAGGAGGALLGGLATKALEGDNRGYSYQLSYADNSTSKFITEKGYLQLGDCVSVERGAHANIRRVASVLCDGGPVKLVEATHVRDAQQCLAAKEQLLAASTSDEIDAASRKVSILCQ